MALQTNHTTDGFHCRPGIAGRQNNPLKYTDPSGYVERYAYWDVKSSGGGGHGSSPVTYDISQYFTMGGAGAIGPGSGQHWSDPYRGGFGNFMLMNSKNFDRYYGSGPYAKAVALYDNKSVFHQWGSGGFGLADVSLLSIKWNPLGGAEVGREQYRKDGTNYLDIYYEGSWALDESLELDANGGGLKLNSTNTFIYDGQWKVDPLTHSMKAGQHVRVEVKNMNIFGVQLDLQDKTLYHYEKTWLGTKKQVYSGDSYTFILLPYQTKTFDFYRFDYVPMNWTFELGTKISDAANVQIRFYSDWVPGMPYDPNHPNR